MNDRHLRQKVIDALDWEPSLDSADIAVAADCGVVTLSGHVPTYAQKAVAEAVVKRIKGVRGIAQDIEVAPEGVVAHSDEDIAKRAVMAISFDVTLPANAIQVRVEGENVTLEGTVDCWRDRELVERTVWAAPGVRTVIDHIHVA